MKTLALDFDGVLHRYDSEWRGADVIPDPPVTGAMSFLRAAATVYQVVIFSMRCHEPAGIRAMRTWLEDHLRSELGIDQQAAEDLVRELTFSALKPKAHLTIDDRAMRFEGVFPSFAEIASFKPWNKR